MYKALKCFNNIAYAENVLIKYKLKPGKIKASCLVCGGMNVIIHKNVLNQSALYHIVSGECAVFDNHRVLHGRVGYTVDPKGGSRSYNGAYVDWDEILSRMNILQTKLDITP